MKARTLVFASIACASVVACHRPVIAPAPQTAAYSLSVRVLPDARAMNVSGTISAPPADHARDSLGVRLGERMAELTVDVVEPTESAGPAVVERVVQPPRERVAGERLSTRWIIRPRRPIPAGERVVLHFTASGGGSTAMIYYVGPEVAFASGWGDLWYPILDGVGGEATGELTVQTPPSWRVISSGRRVSTDTTTGTFRFIQKDATYFTFVAGPYSVATRPGTPAINTWVLTPRNHMRGWMDGAAAMIDVLSREFGPFPFDTLALVEVPRAIAIQAGFNAFSPAGFLVLNSRAFDATDVKFMHEWLGHEMSHQWFPHVLIWDPPGFLYMEEALAEYGGMRVVETLAGEAAAQRQRMTGFEFDPIYSASAYFRLVGAGADEPLATMTSGINQRNLAYTKGAFVFDMLGREIGVPRLNGIMRRLTSGRHFATISWNQFRRAIDEGAGRSMEWFWDQWLNRAGAPEFQLAWQRRGEAIDVVITQSAPFYRASVPVELQGANGERSTRVVEVAGARTTLEITAAFAVERVVLDPRYEVLRWTPAFHALVDSVSKRDIR